MRIQTKYNPKESVWVLHENRPQHCEIAYLTVYSWSNISSRLRYYFTDTDDCSFYKDEDECYPTKEELIESL